MYRFRRAAMIFCILAIGVGIWLRIWGAAKKSALSHDEGITYLCITGHEGEYHQTIPGSYPFGVWPGRPPFGVWAKASDWTRFIKLERRFCFRQIGDDLARFDLHPPLYFWLLHLWALAWGLHFWTGPSLNILLALATLATIFGFGRYVLSDSAEAAAGGALWILSPGVASITLQARQYELLTLLTVLLVWQVVRVSDPTRRFTVGDGVLLALLSAAGMLTHYHFALALLGGGMFLFVKLLKGRRRRLGGAYVAMGTGCALMLLLHPGLLRYAGALPRTLTDQPFSPKALLGRVRSLCEGLFSFFAAEERIIPVALVAGVLLLLAGATLALLVKYRRKPAEPSAPEQGRLYVIYFFLWFSLCEILLYLSFLSPEHAARAKHLAMLWPFFSLVLVGLLRFAGKARPALTSGLIGIMLIAAIRLIPREITRLNGEGPPAEIAVTNQILIDSVFPGRLSPILCQVSDKAWIYAAPQSYLLQHSTSWLSDFDRGAYVSNIRYGNTSKQKRLIIDLLRRHHRVVPVPAPGWQTGEFLRVNPSPHFENPAESKTPSQ
jgi:hypothetical protein